jgi:hypothetical protein
MAKRFRLFGRNFEIPWFAKPETPPSPPSPPPPPPRESPRRRRGRFADDPYYQAWDEIVRRDPNREGPARGYLEHRDVVDAYAADMDLDAQEKLQFWADYNLNMVSRRTGFRRNSDDNPFWRDWHINPDNFDWWGWREAMGYPHGRRKR